MTWLLSLFAWLAVAIIVMATFVSAARRADRGRKAPAPVGVRNLPKPANDRGRAMRWLRRLGVAAAILGAVLPVSHTRRVQAQPLTLPPLHVEAAAPSCVDVRVEGARSLSYDCLNRQLKDDAQTQGATPPAITAKDAAGSGAPNQVGTFSYTATSIRMGNAFGHSAIPQRPVPPSFTGTLVPQHGAR